MVQVVKQANLTCVCKKCKSELSYHYGEVQDYKVNYDYLGDYDLVKGIKCPVCSNIIRVA